MSKDKLTIRSVRPRPVNVPMARPLQTSGGAVSSAPLVLVDLTTEEGPVGRSYIFCYTPLALAPIARLVENLNDVLKGDDLAPVALEAKLQRTFRLLGYQGFVTMALAGIDMAAWDALGQAAGQPLVRLLGGTPRPIPAYNSNGLGIIGAEKAGEEASELLAEGFHAVKVRLGYPDVAADVAVVRAVRRAVGEGTPVMSDYNQSLSVAEAQQRLRHLDGEGLYWVEEPTRFDDYVGHGAIREKAGTPIQLGENCWGPHDMAKALEAGACDYFMIDAVKIGGITGWLRAAALAEPRGLPVSSHLFPEISAHLLAVTPTAHWLEYADWANPVLQQPLVIENGNAIIPDRPGIGWAWDEAAVAKYLV
jgi:mandelate racemase